MAFIKLRIIVGWLLILCSHQAFAEDDYESTPANLYFEHSGGKGQYQSLFAFGLESNQAAGSFGGIYFAESSIGDNGTIRELGIKAFNLSELNAGAYGAEMRIALSKTKLLNYKRLGFEIGLNLYGAIVESLSWYVGSTVRLRELSFDFNDGALTEMRSNIGLHYQLPYNLSAFVYYRYDNFIDSSWSASKIADSTMVGISWLY